MATTTGTKPRATKTRVAPIRTPAPKRKRPLPFPVEFYRSAVGKKWVMALSGIVLIGFVLAHMVGNLKVFMGADDFNHYSEFLRELLVPLLPRTWFLWMIRIALITAFVFHIHAAATLTIINRKARPIRYQSPRDYIAANFASRTMRWTGVIIALYVVFHLLDLTWGAANPDFVRGEVYDNLLASLQRPVVAIVYILAMLALGIHLLHGTWSLFQSLGWNNPRFNRWRRYLAIGVAGALTVGNIAIVLAVMFGVVD